ncbi:MAG: filamentous hemagglutinin N-terminal domain-containing protein [Pleurocapsa sp. MO_226.B13]|nr:filamentous hemagglutinin N-terminal domain-containing protein [Pleurocapsa sp. MO_226.B13]
MRWIKALFVSLQLGLGTLGCLSSRPILAQITSDGTVNTQVNQNGNVAEITGGQTRGGNLFHSFQDFSVPTGNEAFFNNASEISNIFSRVTGGNISNIDGLIRANGSASLFLINPAGIIFGENASLNIGGSFYSSTASSILFEDGEFSAVDNIEQPLLTINAPIGLNFQENSGDIVNRSRVENSSGVLTGLEIASGNNLAFVGGNIRFESGNATARGGNIYLGGLAEAGIVNLDRDGSLSFPDDLNQANITLTNAADVDVVGTGGGNITVDGNNLSLAAGEFGSSLIRGGISSNSTNPQAQAGEVTINVAENITLNESRILNRVDSGGIGNTGNITINTDSLELINGGDLGADTFGQGNAGAVNVTATGDITVDGETSGGFQSGIESLVATSATGNSGGITISTTNLNLTNGGRVAASTLGEGNAGPVNITARGDITATGEDSEGFPSGITSLVDIDTTGDAGGVTISTANLNLTNGGRVDASTFGRGNANNVRIDASESIFIDGSIARFRSGITASALIEDGNGGNVVVNTGNLTIANGGTIEATNFDNIGDDDTPGTGRPGTITIAADSLNLTDARIEAATQFTGEASGIINLNIADELTLENNSFISAQAFGDADGGNLSIDAGFIVAFPNQNNDLIASAAQGRGGNIDLTTNALFGIEERSSTPPNNTNDIDASSEFGLDGTVAIIELDTNPVEGLEELPTEVIDVTRLIAQSLCQQGDLSEFIVTGKGGIAPSPKQPRESEVSEVDLVEPASFSEDGGRGSRPFARTGEYREDGENREEIVEAQGWIINDRGVVELVAYKTSLNGSAPQPKDNNVCDRS